MLWRVTASRTYFNTDQGSQFTGEAFTGVLADNGVAISMDGRGAWRDNVFVERLWRSVKYEEVYLRGYDSVSEARASIGRYLDFYNGRRPHSSLDGMTPDQAYFTRCHSAWQPNLGRGSTYRSGKSVQTTGASSDHHANRTRQPTLPFRLAENRRSLSYSETVHSNDVPPGLPLTALILINEINRTVPSGSLSGWLAGGSGSAYCPSRRDNSGRDVCDGLADPLLHHRR